MMTAALVVAHPGHELLLHHWMEQSRPLYFCLTDGSGGTGRSRLASTERLLRRTGAEPGPLFGRDSDERLYQLLLQHRIDAFVAMRDVLTESLIASGVRCIAGDAMEGFNPTHDVCRALIDGAVAAAAERSGREIENYEFDVHHRNDGTVRVRLDDAALERKLAAANDYPEMRAEVEVALQSGRESLRNECLRPSTMGAMLDAFDRSVPAYETIGEMRVEEGRYRQVIRYREHVLPVIEAVR